MQLTAAGLALTQRAQADHLAGVRYLFLDHLTAQQDRALAAAFSTLAPTAHNLAPLGRRMV